MIKRNILLFLILLLCPVFVKAEQYGMSKFYMNITVQNNGDLVIEEYFDMNGTYNGFERIIHTQNPYAPTFTGSNEDFRGSSIYNGTSLVIEEVRGVDADRVYFNKNNLDQTFASIYENSDVFQKVSFASTGDYGIYTQGYDSVKIYNPNKAFYIKYKVTDVAVLHNDVGEFAWNIFSNEMKESIEDFKVLIHIPNNQNELRGFAHGPLTGNITLRGKTEVLLEVSGLPASTAVDTRVVFDTNVISESMKKTNMDALKPILQYEGEKAEEANKQREEIRQILEKERQKGIKAAIYLGIWAVGLIFILIYSYHKYDKEYIANFKGKYFRDFPSDINPEIVGYLMNKKITTNDLSASILNLIYKKKIKYEKVEKDYKLILTTNEIELTTAEKNAIDLIFNQKTETTLKELNKQAKSGYSSFLSRYETWRQSSLVEGENKHYFENHRNKKMISVLYIIAGIILSFVSLDYAVYPFIHISALVLGIVALIYVIFTRKRTKDGNEEYRKWLGLKKFIHDFGKFEERELPQIELWEKYLVYAVAFGSAKKLSKQMKLKIDEYNLNQTGIYYNSYSMSHVSDMLVLNHIINRNISSAHSNAISARNIANSSSSSSGGFGGGFSSGGGSFGGGGGGGRF